MDNILTELWYGTISPWEQCNRGDTAVQELSDLLQRNRDRLTADMTEAQRELLEKYDACQTELEGKAEKNAFVHGFCLGARLLAAVMSEREPT